MALSGISGVQKIVGLGVTEGAKEKHSKSKAYINRNTGSSVKETLNET